MEPLRKEQDLTTADIANPVSRNQEADVQHTDVRGPELVGREPQLEARADVASNDNATNKQAAPLFPDNELRDFRGRWSTVQTSFVDEPRAAVEQADSLVATVVKRIAEQFAAERAQLEKQWDRGDDVSTEDLRQALRRYRSFFDRLLSV